MDDLRLNDSLSIKSDVDVPLNEVRFTMVRPFFLISIVIVYQKLVSDLTLELVFSNLREKRKNRAKRSC